MEKITFETNVPRELCLKFIEGKLGESQFGGNQYMFSTDQGPFWVSEAVGNILHDQIKKQGVQAGDSVDICKREVSQGNGRKAIRWELKAVGAPGEQPNGTFVVPVESVQPEAATKVAAPAVAAHANVQPQSNGPIASNGNSNGRAASNGHAASELSQVHLGWAQFLIAQTNALVDSYAAALSYASSRHGNTVKADDVRALLTTAYIAQTKNGVAHVA
jgi:hypothetical protein